MLIVLFQVSQNFEKVSWLALQKSSYQLKFDFLGMTFCPKKCHGCIVTMTFKWSTMTFLKLKDSVKSENYEAFSTFWETFVLIIVPSWEAKFTISVDSTISSFSKFWKSVMVGTAKIKLPVKIRFSSHDILSKKVSWLRHNHDI